MNTRFCRLLGFFTSLLLALHGAQAGVVPANFNTPGDIPVTAPNFIAAGNTVEIRLNHAPQLAQPLTVVNNIGNEFIQGEFGNLTQGQVVPLTFGSVTYTYVANYYGGTGNDLVLVWVRARPFAWGMNSFGQLGDSSVNPSQIPIQTNLGAVMPTKTVVSMAAGEHHTLALCSDGTVFSWGANDFGQLGDNTINPQLSPVPVAVTGTALQGKKVIAIAAGQNHSLALCSDGTIAAWGLNIDGQLGDLSNAPRLAPVAVFSTGLLAGRTVAGIAAGANHSVAFCTDGTVYAWGKNDMNQLGDNNGPVPQNRPVAVNNSTALNTRQVVAIAAGANHTLALCSDNTLAAWGDNTDSQHGNGGSTVSPTPVQVTTVGTPLFGKTIKRIAAGGYHNLVLCTDGTLAAWGKGTQGQIGNNAPANQPLPASVQITGTALDGKQVTSIAAGAIHSLALCSDGTLTSWGGNGAGQLGDGTIALKLTPVTVNTTSLLLLERFAGVFSGPLSSHTLAPVPLPPPPPTEIAVFKNVGTLPADEIFTPSPFSFTPTTVGSITAQFFTIQNTGSSILVLNSLFSSGANAADYIIGLPGTNMLLPGATTTFSVAFNPSGVGARNAQIQIINNDPDETPFVIDVTGTGNSLALVATYNTGNEVPLTTNVFGGAGSTVTFNLNFAPATGQEFKVVNVTGSSPIATPFDNLTQGQVVPLSFGGGIYSFLANYHGGDGNDLVLVWSPTQLFGTGLNVDGELGNNSTLGSSVLTPVDTAGILSGRTVVKVVSGGTHSLALCLDGTLVALGSNGSGELGDGTNTASLVAVPVSTSGTLAGRRVIDIAAGISMSMALCSDGTLHTWGLNADGQLGIGNFTDRNAPMIVNGSGVITTNNVVKIAAGAYHSMALLKNGTLAVWGRNNFGQLGDNSFTNLNAPVSINNSGALVGQRVVAMSAGAHHSMALLDDGTLTSWGSNTQGQLGNGSFSDSIVPTPVNQAGVLAGKSIKSISSGGFHNLVCCHDGTLVGWGWNSAGQVGDGSTVDREFPTLVDVAGVLSGKTAVKIVAYRAHSVVLCADGTAASWGANGFGQLGDGTLVDRTVPTLLDLTPLNPVDRITHISTGSLSDHTLALVARGLADISVFTGANTAPANERFTGDTFSFADQGVGSIGTPQTFTIKNTGSTPLTGLSASANGGNAIDFIVSGPPPAPLAPGASTTFTVAFSPNASGTRSTTILISSNDVDENPFTISVDGFALSNNADLNDLTATAGAISPIFSPANTGYTISVPNATASTTVRPTVFHPMATVTVNGTTVASGNFSGNIPLAVGLNTISVEVTAEDTTTTKTYTIDITRAPSSNATLASLTTSAGTLNPGFNGTTFTYSTNVTNATTTISVTPTVQDSTATIEVNSSPVASGSPSSAIPLTVGINTITVQVTAQDTTTILTTTISVTRAPSSNATLSGLTSTAGALAPGFGGGIFNYNISVPNTTTSTSVTAITADPTAALEINSSSVSSGSPFGPIPLVVGPNTIEVEVTAEDGTTKLTYTVTINRAPSSNATLATISLSAGTLVPPFSSGTFAYTTSVPNSTASISATAFTADPTATLTINGTPRASGSPLNGIPLAVGANTITVNVTAQDGTTMQAYTVTVTRQPSTNAFLANLTTPVGGLSPSFTSGTFDYLVFVPSSTTTATVTPTVQDSTATIEVNGLPVASGLASASIPLAIGSNFVSVEVTAQDGTTIVTYTVEIYRYLNSDATLIDLTTSAGTINPVFDPFTFSYTANVSAGTASTTVTPTVNDPNATIEVDGLPVSSGSASSPITLVAGPNTITVDVTAEDGTTTETYTLTVTRGVSSNANLLNLTTSDGSLSPSFDPGTFTYEVYVGNSTTDITVNPIVEDATASIEVNGIPVASGDDSDPVTLSVGSNFITVNVTAQDGTTILTYDVEVIRDPSSDATLANLTTSAGAINPVFNPFTFSYTANVSAVTTSTTVTPTVNDSTALIEVNGIPVSSGTASSPITLVAGPNVITVDVFAEDGITIETYTLTVTRGVSSNANLFNLYTSDGFLSPAFGSAIFTYEVYVGNSTADITVNATVEDALATILVDGTPVSSGFDSAPIPLAVGSNFITVNVTAEDGTTTLSYSLEVIRDPSSDATLADLIPSAGTLSPGFDPFTFNYTVSVPGGVNSASVTPTVADPNATIEVDGIPVISGTASSPVSLSVGSNIVSVDVTAQDGSTIFTYFVDFVRGAGTDASLSSLTTTAGGLNPTFNSGVFTYTAAVPNSTASATVSPTTTDPAATITVNGTPVASGAASTLIPLATGLNTITVEVTAQDGSTTQSYTLEITRALDTDATLANLTTTAGALSPVFGSGLFNYTASVPLATTSTTITPFVNNPAATVTVNSTPVTSGTASGPLSLSVGPNLFNVVVTAEDGSTTLNYTLTVTRGASNNASLASLTTTAGILAPAFSPGTYAYTATVGNATTSITVTPTTADPAATVTVNGIPVATGSPSPGINLAIGTNSILVDVTAQDGMTTLSYTITVTRGLSSNANLSSLTTSAGSIMPVFTPGNLNYSVNTASNTVFITPTTQDAAAAVTVNGMPTLSGTPSGPVTLTPGINIITITVTSGGGNVKNYFLTFDSTPTFNAVFNAATDIPASSFGFTPTTPISFTLNFAPDTGTELMVIENTSRDFIVGTFTGLPQGQIVPLTYGGQVYNFVADYFGGNGNDLVLLWAGTRLFAWGDNDFGQLGDATTTGRRLPAPATTTGALLGKTVASIATGTVHTLARTADGSVLAWGYNSFGQLGDGTQTERNVPVDVITTGVLAGKTVAAVAAGGFHSMALCSDGTVATWGNNGFGQLGNGTLATSTTPVAVNTSGALAGKTVIAISAGYLHSMALCSDGTLVGWGNNREGELGDGTNVSSNVPVAVINTGALDDKSIEAISAGAYHSMVLCSDGSVVAWGNNSSGQLGDGTTTQSLIPILINTSAVTPSESSVRAISAGGYHSMALISNGSVAAWGGNGEGQLGIGTKTSSPSPVTVLDGGVLSGKTATAIAAGAYHSKVLCSDGTLATWGRNKEGQLGDNSNVQRLEPVLANISPLAPGSLFTKIFDGSTAYHNFAAVALPPSPEISIFKGISTATPDELQDENVFQFDPTPVGSSSVTQTFTIHNTGTVPLSGIAVSLAVTDDPGEFVVSAPALTTLPVNATTTFTVTFLPTSAGARNATLLVESDDSDENPFTINLFGSDTDITAAVLEPVTIISDNVQPDVAKAGDTITLSFTASETIQPPLVLIAGEVATLQDIGDNIWIATLVVSPTTTQGLAAIQIAFADTVGNHGFVTATTDASSITIDTIDPIVAVPGSVFVDPLGGPNATVNFSVSATDNLSIPLVNVVPPSGSVFPVGNTTVTATATDLAGNTKIKTFVVHVGAIAPDSEKPVVFINAPKQNAKITGDEFDLVTVNGHAADNTQVANVLVSINGGTFLPASLVPGSGGVAWAIQVTPDNGLNSVAVKSVDVSGNESSPASVSFKFINTRLSLVGAYHGLVVPTEDSITPADQVGSVSINVLPTGIFTGKLILGGSSKPVALTGVFGNDGSARFGKMSESTLSILRKNKTTVTLALTLDTLSPGTDKITGTLEEAGNLVVARVNADRFLYTAKADPIAPRMNVPVSLLDPATDKGKYTVALPALSTDEQGVAPGAYPQGDGWALMSVSPAGLAKAVGKLADGTPFTCARPLSKSNEWPLYLTLYGKGSLSGVVTFRDVPGVSDADATGVRWFRPSGSGSIYKDGWPDGIEVDFVASKYVPPAAGSGENALLIDGAPSASIANVEITIADDFTFDPLINSASMNAASQTTNLSSGISSAGNLKLSIKPATGKFSGSFDYQPMNIKATQFNGVILQKQHTGSGYFIGSPAGSKPSSGAVIVAPLELP